MSTLGAYHDECGDIMSTPGDVQYTGVRFHTNSIVFPMTFPHIYHDPPRCTHDISQCTHDIPQRSEHPPLYFTLPGVLHRHYAG